MKRFSYPQSSQGNASHPFDDGGEIASFDPGNDPAHWQSAGEELASPSGESIDDLLAQHQPFTSPTWIDAGDRPRGQHALCPVHYTPSYAYPLVVYFHSANSNASELLQVMPHVSLRNYVAVSLGGNRASDQSGHRFDWSHGDAAIGRTVDDTVEAIADVRTRYNIHEDRMVFAGVRDGGTMALRMALELPDTAAACVSIGGRMPDARIRNWKALQASPMRMLWQWGTDNPKYHDADLREDCRRARRINARVDLRLYTVDDESDRSIYADANDWIMKTVVSNSTGGDRWASTPVSCSKN
ncbi:MAG: hypothetical protein AAF958_02090 [Planctomycetota bacterium]